MKKFVALIPARGGSKGIKNKNLVKINGKSLVDIAIEFAIKSKIFSKIILSSDEKRILKRGNNKGIITHYRNKNLALDHSLLSDTILKIKETYNLKKNWILIILEPTSPLRNLADLKIACKKITKDKLDSYCTFTESFISPYRIWNITKDNLKPLIKNKYSWAPRQKFKKFYQPIGNIIALNLEKFTKKKKILFGKKGYDIVSKKRSIDIDSPDDLEIVKKIMKKYQTKF